MGAPPFVVKRGIHSGHVTGNPALPPLPRYAARGAGREWSGENSACLEEETERIGAASTRGVCFNKTGTLP